MEVFLGTLDKPFRSRDLHHLHRYAVSVMRRAEAMGLLPEGEVIEVLDREAMPSREPLDESFQRHLNMRAGRRKMPLFLAVGVGRMAL